MSEEQKSFTERDLVLFEPSKRDMLLDYPELKDYEAFTNISKRDLIFVWYISNRTSPIIREPKDRRIKLACEFAYPAHVLKNNERVMGIYNEAEFPQEILEAIDVMSSFNPSFRMRAKLLNEHNFEQLQALVYLSEEEKGAMDLDDKKKYSELLIKTSNALPSMIQAMETGYGVKVKKEKKEEWSLKTKGITEVVDRVEKT